MGLTDLRAVLSRHRRVALDANVFIYQEEAHPRYLPLTREVFSWLESPQSTAITATMTMTELLVLPYRQGDQARADLFYVLLSTYPHLEWIPLDLKIADIAARLCATHRLKTPDSVQAATAMGAGATLLISNDAVFERVKDFETLVLDRYL